MASSGVAETKKLFWIRRCFWKTVRKCRLLHNLEQPFKETCELYDEFKYTEYI